MYLTEYIYMYALTSHEDFSVFFFYFAVQALLQVDS